MLLRNLFNKSLYGCIGYVENHLVNPDDSIGRIIYYINLSKESLVQFKDVLFAFNWAEFHQPHIDKLESEVKKVLPHALFIHLKSNRGHNFGTVDLDQTVFDYCNYNNIQWLCKSSIDMVLMSSCLDRIVSDSDFYYLPALSYESAIKLEFNYDYSLPQTNLYIVNLNKIENKTIINMDYIDKTWSQIHNIRGYNGKIWEYISGWSCEEFLNNFVIKNKLSKSQLITLDEYNKLKDIILFNKVGDPSHKNIQVGDFIHYHYFGTNIIG